MSVARAEMRAETGWFVTASGLRFYPLDPRAEDVRLDDIAHALANLCRFGGHCRLFYSVAQHSVLVSRLVHPSLALPALMHDATEAYVGDVVRPLKRGLAGYREIEERVAEAISERFGLPKLSDAALDEIKLADNRALMTERRDLITAPAGPWLEDEARYPADRAEVVALEPWAARREFLARFEQIGWEHPLA